MSAPLLLLVLTGLATIICLLLRTRPGLGSSVAAGAALLIGSVALFAPIDEPQSLLGVAFKLEGRWLVLGRSFVLQAGNRASVAFLYVAGGFLLGGVWAAGSGRYHASVGLATLAMLASAQMVEPFLYAAIFLEFAAMGGVIILVGSSSRAWRGSLSLLILYTLAMMAILMTGWLLENAGVTSVTEDLAGRVLTLLAPGFAVLMFVPPFHFWLPAASRNANPLALASVATLLQSSGLFFLLRFLDTYQWIRLAPGLYPWLRIVGAGMVLYGALATVVQRELRALLAYALISSGGALLICLGLGSASGVLLALGISASIVISMALLSLAAALLGSTTQEGPEAPEVRAADFQASKRAMLVGTAAFGLLGLAGFPMSPGFAARWTLLVESSLPEPQVGFALLLGTMLISYAVGRWAIVTVAESPTAARRGGQRQHLLFLGIGLALALTITVFPGLIGAWVRLASQGLTQLIP